MNYLQNSYYIDGYNRGASWGRNITKYAEEHGVKKLNEYLQEFNYDFFLEYGSKSTGEGATVFVGSDEKIVFFKRKSFPFPRVFYDESQGNQVFADMLPNLIYVLENPGMLIFDEFGNSLHNKLAEKIVKFFMKNAKKSKNIGHVIFVVEGGRPDTVFLQSYFLGKDLKPEVAKTGFSEEDIETDEHLIHAVTEMNRGLEAFNLGEYDLDNLAPTLLGVYDYQQEKQKTDATFSLLSLISMALLELGIITEYEDSAIDDNANDSVL